MIGSYWPAENPFALLCRLPFHDQAAVIRVTGTARNHLQRDIRPHMETRLRGYGAFPC